MRWMTTAISEREANAMLDVDDEADRRQLAESLLQELRGADVVIERELA